MIAGGQFSKLGRAALAYSKIGWPVFPCRLDKKPLTVHGFKDASTDREQIIEWWTQFPDASIGHPTAGQLVLDVDTKEVDGYATLRELIRKHGTLPLTPYAKTGTYAHGRGCHYFFAAPDVKISNSASKLGPGLDIRSNGGYVILAPSPHPVGSVRYEWERRPTDVPLGPAPDWLITLLTAKPDPPPRPKLAANAPPVSDKYAAAALTNEQALVAAAPGTRNAALNNAALKLGQLVGAGMLTEAHIWDALLAACETNGLLADDGLAQCEATIRSGLAAGKAQPREIRKDAQYQRALRPAMGGARAKLKVVGGSDVDANGVVQEAPPAHPGGPYVLDAKGNPIRKNFHNAVMRLASEPELVGLFACDDFAHKIMVTRRPPWALNGFTAGHLTDDLVTGARIWLEAAGFTITQADAHIAIAHLASDCHTHPVRDYLEALHWDGIPRLDTWLIDYAGAEDSAFTRHTSAKFLIGAVGRIMRPGAKMDTMLILEGEQGIRKSMAVETLFGMDWTRVGVQLFDSHQKMVLAMAGAWCIEIAELQAVRSAKDQEKVKALVSTRIDNVVLPYGRNATRHPRQCVFFGTLNPGASLAYLNDETGGRRYWPIPVKECDTEALAEVRDHLWAEATHRYYEGESWWLTDPGVVKDARIIQSDRTLQHPWTDMLRLKIGDHRTSIGTHDCYEILELKARDRSKASEMIISESMRALGWRKIRRTRDGVRSAEWVRN